MMTNTPLETTASLSGKIAVNQVYSFGNDDSRTSSFYCMMHYTFLLVDSKNWAQEDQPSSTGFING